MHNVNTEAVEAAAKNAMENPQSALVDVNLSGSWNATDPARPQFVGTIPYPKGELEFTCDFPPPFGGQGRAPNPLAYCLWGGVACYAMTFASEAARLGVELVALRGTVTTQVNGARALGVSARPPVQGVSWSLDVESSASAADLEQVKRLADERCPGVWCMQNVVPLETTLAGG